MRITAFLLFFALPAFADMGPPSLAAAPVPARILSSGAMKGTLCWSQTATSTGCTVPTTQSVDLVSGTTRVMVADLTGFTTVALYSNQSTATTYTCRLYSSDNGYDADSGVGQLRTDGTPPALTETQEMVVVDGALAKVWVECSAINVDGVVNLTFTATR